MSLTKKQLEMLVEYLADSRSPSTIIDRLGLATTPENEKLISTLYSKHYYTLCKLPLLSPNYTNDFLRAFAEETSPLTTR